MQPISIVGTYQTKFAEHWDKSLNDLIIEAITGCLRDSAVNKTQVQSVYIGNMLGSSLSQEGHLGSLVSQIIQSNVPVTRVEAACASGSMALHTGIQAILSGSTENALIIGAEKMTDCEATTISKALMAAASQEESDSGLSFPGLYAMMAHAYFWEFGAQESDLAKVSVKNHHHAKFNALAQFPFEVTLEQVLNSPRVADPLKMLDCSPVTDGAAAVFIASSQWVKKHQAKNGVMITGSAMATDCISLSGRQSLTQLKATQLAAQKAYQQAGIEIKDIDCVEVHDCFTIAEILALEDLGLYARGEGYHYLNEQETWLGGKRPVNTSGGLKACGHPVGATGIKQIVEATTQLKEQASGRQVKDAQVAVTQNVGGTGGTAVVHVLQK
jgi:acetyl-CoA C-acetyltransferase